MENYDDCLRFANKIRLEFPIVEIFFPKKSKLFSLPPRNLFVFSRSISGEFGNANLVSIHFVTDADLIGDDFMPYVAASEFKLELRHLYIMFDDLKDVLKKIYEICPEKSFERLFLNNCVSGELNRYRESWGTDLIEMIYRVAIFTIGMVKKGRSNLLITKTDSDAFGNDLLMLIRNLTINNLMEPEKRNDNSAKNVDFLLLIDEGNYLKSFGADLVNYINRCSVRAIEQSKLYMDDVPKAVPGFHRRSVSLSELISPPEWTSFSSELWHL